MRNCVCVCVCVRACVCACVRELRSAGDSATGSQDNWVEYDSAASASFEAARRAGLDEVKVDTERFIDLKHMLQRRYDDVDKRRTIKRTETKKRAAATVVTDGSSHGRKKRRVGTSVQASATLNDTGAGAAAASTTGAMPPAVGHLSLPNVPDVWDSFDSLDYFEVNVDKGSNEFEWISKIVQETTEGAHTMNDFNHKIKFRRLEIVKIMRVQNPSTWMAYNSFREQIIRSAPSPTSISLSVQIFPAHTWSLITHSPHGPFLLDRETHQYLHSASAKAARQSPTVISSRLQPISMVSTCFSDVHLQDISSVSEPYRLSRVWVHNDILDDVQIQPPILKMLQTVC
jgi:hypothetical protein